MNCLLSGVFLGISNLFRPEGIVGVIAVIVWFVYFFIKAVRKTIIAKTIIKTLICVSVFLLGYVRILAYIGLSYVD